MKLHVVTLVSVLHAAGCAAIEHDDWRFCASRRFCGEFLEKMDANEAVFDAESFRGMEDSAGASVLIFPILLALPLALDVVCLPVTLPHDLVAN